MPQSVNGSLGLMDYAALQYTARGVGADEMKNEDPVISPYLLRPLRTLEEVERALARPVGRADAPAACAERPAAPRPPAPQLALAA